MAVTSCALRRWLVEDAVHFALATLVRIEESLTLQISARIISSIGLGRVQENRKRCCSMTLESDVSVEYCSV
jgi:hypothetical protein